MSRNADWIIIVEYSNSVFGDVMKLVPWDIFNKLVKEHRTDELFRTFSTKHQFAALLYGQLSGTKSLRDLELCMDSQKARIERAGAVVPRRSTLADADQFRSPNVFVGVFKHMLGMVERSTRRLMYDAIRLIDSTSLRLSGAGSEWARFSAEVCGAKAHFVFDPDLGCPTYHMVTAAKVNDIVAAKEMPIDAGATYVFDLGYYDFGWWSKLDDANCRIVTRFRKNTPLKIVKSTKVEPGTCIVSDKIGFLPARQGNIRKNPFRSAVREIVIRMDNGGKLRVLTNDLDASAQEIADLYKRRWLIELFFRVMKQNFKIVHLLGRSPNAIRIQIAIALISFLLMRMVCKKSPAPQTLLETVRLVRANLMQRRDLTTLKHHKPSSLVDSSQISLNSA